MGKEEIGVKHETEPSKLLSLFPVLLGMIAIPLALTFWFTNIWLFHLPYKGEDEMEHIPPTRWLASISIPIIVAGNIINIHKLFNW